MSELRVFISSTFRDLQEEREHLAKKIFPEIRALLRERGITFTEVDLRWGLTEEDQLLGQVIRTCLEEIDRCRPYFIGIIGNRYGYIPTLVEVHKDPRLLEQYPWIEDAILEEPSIIDLEIRHAVLNAPCSDSEGARFYFRRERETLDGDPWLDTERQRLEDLKERVRQHAPSWGEFRDPISLGEMVYDDLVRIIKRDFVTTAPPSPLELERRAHQAFAASRRKAYIPNASYLRRLNEHVASTGPPLIVYAESGSGKSALLAYWAEQYRRRHTDTVVVEHYVGIGAGSTDHYGIIRHVMSEIREWFGRTEQIPSAPADLEREFPNWLGFTQDHPIVLLLDGVNQLGGAALSLSWLPRFFPSNIRFIISSTVERTLVRLRNRGWTQLGLQPLEVDECEAIIVRFLAEFGKALPARLITRIARDRKCASPLFLRTLLEELRLSGDHDRLEETVEHYLQATGTEDLFQRVLERLEDDFNRKIVRDMMTMVWASRSGLSEAEIAEITGVSRLTLSSLVIGLDYHCIRKDGLLTFFHDYLRRAVETRYVEDENRRKGAHLRLADYFLRRADRRREETREARHETGDGADHPPAGDGAAETRGTVELAHQLSLAEAWDRLAANLSSIPLLITLRARSESDLLIYLAEITKRGFDLEELLAPGLAERRAGARTDDLVRGLEAVAWVFEMSSRWEASMRLYEEILTRIDPERAPQESSMLHRRLARLHKRLGDMPQAETHADAALSLAEASGDDASLVHACVDFSYLLSYMGDLERAGRFAERALGIAEGAGDKRLLLNGLDAVGGVAWESNRVREALATFSEIRSIAEELGDIVWQSSALDSLGNAHGVSGEFDRAVECFERSMEGHRRLGNRDFVHAAQGNLGGCYHHLGDYARALEMYDAALAGHRAIGSLTALPFWLEGRADVLLDLVERERSMPDSLAPCLPGAEEGTWRAMAIDMAEGCVRESLDLAARMKNPWTLFWGRIQSARINALKGETDQALATLTEVLREMRDPDAADDFSPPQRQEYAAEAHYWLWKLRRVGEGEMIEPARESHRREATTSFQHLMVTRPTHRFRERLEDLGAIEHDR